MSGSPIAGIFPVTLSRRLGAHCIVDSHKLPFSPTFNLSQQTADRLGLRSGRFARQEALEVGLGPRRLPDLEVEDTEIVGRRGKLGMRRVRALHPLDLPSRFISFPLGEQLIRPKRTVHRVVQRCIVSQALIAGALRGSGSETFDLTHRVVEASFLCIDARRYE